MATQHYVTDGVVGGIVTHEEVTITEKDFNGEHIKTIVKNIKKGDQHIDEVETVTNVASDAFVKRVVSTTTTLPTVRTHTLVSTTDKYTDFDHIFTSLTITDGPDGKTEDHLTVVDSLKDCSLSKTHDIVNSSGDKFHEELIEQKVDGVCIQKQVKVKTVHIGTELITTIVRSDRKGDNTTCTESVVTTKPDEDFYKEVIKTTTTSLDVETSSLKVITTKDCYGEHVRTELMSEDGPEGHREKNITVIAAHDDESLSKIVDSIDFSGKKVHRELREGDHTTEKLRVVKEQIGNEQITNATRYFTDGDVHTRTETKTTTADEGSFYKEVINTTTTSLDGEMISLKVVTAKDCYGEHVRTELMSEDGPEGHREKNITVIAAHDDESLSKIVDSIDFSGKKVHRELREGDHTTEKLRVVKEQIGDKTITSSVRYFTDGDVHTRIESEMTTTEEDDYSREVINTTTTSLDVETSSLKVITTKDCYGEHVRTELMSEDGPEGHREKNITVIAAHDDESLSKIVDSIDFSGKKVHRELREGDHTTEKLRVVKEQIGDKTITSSVRYFTDSDVHTRIESEMTTSEEDDYSREVINTTTTSLDGEVKSLRVVTAKDCYGEHVRTELMSEDGPEGHREKNITVIAAHDDESLSKIVDSIDFSGKKVHRELREGDHTTEKLRVVKEQVGDKTITSSVRCFTDGDVHTRIESEMTTAEEDDYSREVINTTTTSLDVETSSLKVITTKDCYGEHVRTELMSEDGPEGHREKNITVIAAHDDESLSKIVDSIDFSGKKVHRELREGDHTTEKLRVVKEQVGDKTITSSVRCFTDGDVHTRIESEMTTAEEDDYSREVINTTTTSLDVETSSLKVITTKDCHGEHVRTELLAEDGPEGHREKNITVIAAHDDESLSKIVDSIDFSGKKVHRELREGDHTTEKLRVVKEQVGNEQITNATRYYRDGDVHTRIESKVVSTEEDNFYKEVINTTTTSLNGDTHSVKVVTDKDCEGEHIRTESMSEDAPDGHIERNMTLVEAHDDLSFNKVADSIDFTEIAEKLKIEEQEIKSSDNSITRSPDNSPFERTGSRRIYEEIHDRDGTRGHIHKQLRIVDENVNDKHVKTIVVDENENEGCICTHEESVIVDLAATNYHKEISNISTTTLIGQHHVNKVTIDRHVNGNHLHSEHVICDGPDGEHDEQDYSVSTKLTGVVNNYIPFAKLSQR